MTRDGEASIEVGQVADPNVPEGGGLRLWRAREAIRNAELRLQAQAAALATLESRAQALVGWIAAALTALVGAALLTTVPSELRWAAGGGGAALSVALVFAVATFNPGDWDVVGHNPADLVRSNWGAELYELEGMALSYAEGIGRNSARLEAVATRLRNALLAIVWAPFTACGGAAGWAVAGWAVAGWRAASAGSAG